MKFRFFLLVIFYAMVVVCLLCLTPTNSYAFTRIVDLVFDGMSVEPDKLQEVLSTIKKNKIKNKKIKNLKKLKPDKLFVITAKRSNPKNIQLEIDTSEVVVKSNSDIQAPISNQGFLDAVSEAISLWGNVNIADISFAPLKFASGQADPNDGRNIITFRGIKAPEGVAAGSNVVTIVNYARTDTVQFMNKLIMVKPGTILDADIVYDPTNDPCLALETTTGDFKIGGENVSAAEGGVDPQADLSSCQAVSGGDITDIAVQGIASVLGLESSAIVSAANTHVAQIMERYALTNDDKISVANLYPAIENLKDRGTIKGKVLLNKKPVRGAHVVLEDTMTGEPVTSAVTTISGNFIIKAIPAGTYTAYAEPLDGPIRKNALMLNFFTFTPDLNFTTGVNPTPVTISSQKTTSLNIEVKELSASAFNINVQTSALNETDINAAGGAALAPIRIMPGETLTNVQFWGDNISTDFGTLSISGPGVTLSNIKNASIPVSPFVRCSNCEDTPTTMCKRDSRCPDTQEITAEPDQIPGLTADITCDPATAPGPRNIIFTGDQVDMTHPSFGLRDQITGGLVITE
ncbi:MAG: hypothetical protein HY094_01200 [Candidatus Melainabacteria bacterium]|nr:hypothetical protein [Candidatus Melainabacteria bacterium]